MAEYIKREDALKIIDNYSKACTEEGMIIANAIRDIVGIITPAADVIPKEFLTLKEDEAYQRGYAEAKTEVAREFIEAIDSMMELVCAMTGLELTYFGKYAELRKKYTEETK